MSEKEKEVKRFEEKPSGNAAAAAGIEHRASRGQNSNGFSWSLSLSLPLPIRIGKREKEGELVTNSMMIAQSARVSSDNSNTKPPEPFCLQCTHTHSLSQVLVCFGNDGGE